MGCSQRGRGSGGSGHWQAGAVGQAGGLGHTVDGQRGQRGQGRGTGHLGSMAVKLVKRPEIR